VWGVPAGLIGGRRGLGLPDTRRSSNVVVDISDLAEEKGAAVRMWKSQIANRAFDHYILGLNAFNIRLLPKARYVEAFFVAPLADYCDLCARYFRDPASAFYNPAYRS
jgi:hypothetical protein